MVVRHRVSAWRVQSPERRQDYGHLRQGQGSAQRAQRASRHRLEKAGDFVDEKTEGKYAEQVDQGQTMAKDKTRSDLQH